ncbi:unnamed protein product [Candidula unifasciata]|uniref:Uncharacterized protein n=1 Tax=Candidula unifasciata TaxID=100452 RepID=A0A8S3Z0M8_9EUPU|nr:unnamed protein product [Candidula unifasciata]
MARHLKNFEKHSLLARRKNNTASKMLEEKLKYMEQKFNRDYRQYLRVKSRVQSELKVIEDVASNYDEDQSSKTIVPTLNLHPPVEEKHVLHYSRHTGIVSEKHSYKKQELQTENKKLVICPDSSKNPPQSLNNNPNVASRLSKNTSANGVDSTKGRSSKHEDASMLSAKVLYNYKQLSSFPPDNSRYHKILSENSHGSHLSVANNASTIPDSSTLTTSTPGEVAELSSDILCKYSPNSQACHCRHFPCVPPKTYHTLGQGSSDGIIATGEESDSSTGNFSTHLKVPQKSRSQTSPNPNLTVTVGLQNPSHKTSILTSNLILSKDMAELKIRAVNELGMRPSFPGPRLDRRGSLPTKFQIEESNRARVTIKDKTRGLKQMVSEMRAKNDLQKPREWVVNYGHHFPARILLNPVMP